MAIFISTALLYNKNMKKVMGNTHFKKFVISGLITSLCAPAISYALSVIFEVHLTLPFLLIIYFLPLTIYFFDFSYKQYRLSFLAFLPAFFSVGLILKYSENKFLLIYLIALVSSLCYPIFLKDITKKIPLFKNFVVATMWAILVIIFSTYFELSFSYLYWIFFLLVFIRTFVDISYSDLKDINEDKSRGVKTLAVTVGIDKTIIILQLLNLLSGLIIIILSLSGILPLISISLLVPIIFSTLSIYYFSRRSNFSTLVVDLEYLFWFLSPLIVRILWNQ